MGAHVAVNGHFVYVYCMYVGLSYRTGKCYEKAVQAYERAADAHYKNNSYPRHHTNVSCIKLLMQ